MTIRAYRTHFIQELSSIYEEGEAESFFYLILEEKQKLKRRVIDQEQFEEFENSQSEQM